MGLYALDFAEELPEPVRREFESHFAKLKQLLSTSLNEDGTLRLTDTTGDTTFINQFEDQGHLWRKGPWSLLDYGGGVEGAENAHYLQDLYGGTLDNFGDQGQISGAIRLDFNVHTATTFTGIVNDTPFPGRARFLIVKNVYQTDATKTLTLKHNNTGSRYECRFNLPAATDVILAPGEAAWLVWGAGAWEMIVTGQTAGGILAGISSSPLTKVTKTFSASGDFTVAQIKALNSTPQTLVTPSSGDIVVPVVWSLDELRGGTDTFNATPTFSLRWNGVASDILRGLPMIAGASAGTKQFSLAHDLGGAASSFTGTVKGAALQVRSNSDFASVIGTGSACAWRFSVLYYTVTSVN